MARQGRCGFFGNVTVAVAQAQRCRGTRIHGICECNVKDLFEAWSRVGYTPFRELVLGLLGSKAPHRGQVIGHAPCSLLQGRTNEGPTSRFYVQPYMFTINPVEDVFCCHLPFVNVASGIAHSTRASQSNQQ